MSHFFLAMAMLGLAVVVALEARALASGQAGIVGSVRALGWLGLGLLPLGIALLVTGAFVTAAGPSSGGADIRRLGNLEDALYVHVRISACLGIVLPRPPRRSRRPSAQRPGRAPARVRSTGGCSSSRWGSASTSGETSFPGVSSSFT